MKKVGIFLLKINQERWIKLLKYNFHHPRSRIMKILTVKEIPSKATPTRHHKLEVSSSVPKKGNGLGDKGTKILQSLPHLVPRDNGR